ncbi:hypothetical protein Tco_1196861, partial [Tanacetum coccineum]
MEPIPQPKQFPHSETYRGGPSSEQHTQGSLTNKEYQELLELQDEEALRQTLEEKARAEKELEEKIVTTPKSGSSGIVTLGCYFKYNKQD